MEPEWPRMVDVLTPGKQGNAEVYHFDVTREAMRLSFDPHAPSPGRYCGLKVGGHLMMSDTHHERMTNATAVRMARGRVLIAGLGLGWILHPILAKPEVTSVTVVEMSADVIALVAPSLAKYGDRLRIVHSDIHLWLRVRDTGTWDTIYFDIWGDICTDDLREHAALNRRVGRRLNPGGWRGGWCFDILRAKARAEKRHEMMWRL